MGAKEIQREAVVTANGHFQLHKLGSSASGCSGCAQRSGCGASVLSRASRPGLVPAAAALRRWDTGQEVVFSASGRWVAAVAAAVYAGLAVLLLLGAVLGAQFDSSGGDVGALCGAFLGLSVGAILLRLYDAHSGSQLWLQRVTVSPVSKSVAQRF